MSCGVLQDWEANAGNFRIQFLLLLFRIAQRVHRLPQALRWLGLPYLGLYQLFAYWLMGIELNYKATIGPRLKLFHGYALVIHDNAVLGADCILRHGTTIGMRKGPSDCPVIGNGVDIGCHAILLGFIKIGDGARIGAGSVVLHDVEAGMTVVGNPARLITE